MPFPLYSRLGAGGGVRFAEATEVDTGASIWINQNKFSVEKKSGPKLAYTLELSRKQEKQEKIEVELELSSNLEGNLKLEFYNPTNGIGVSTGAAIPAGTPITKEVNSDKTCVTLNFSKTNANSGAAIRISGINAAVYNTEKKKYVAFPPGADLTLKVTVRVGGQVQDTKTLNYHVDKYNKIRGVYLAGAAMGSNYGYGLGDGQNSPVKAYKGTLITNLEQLEGKEFSFDGLFTKEGWNEKFPAIEYDRDKGIANPYMGGKTWKLVGFVPCEGTLVIDDKNAIDAFKTYVFSENSGADGFTEGSEDDAKTYVDTNGGILYGDDATGDKVKEISKKVSSQYVTLMCVWYVSPQAPIEHGAYGDLGIRPVPAVNYQPTSPDVRMSFGEVTFTLKDSESGRSTFEVALDIAIGENAPDRVNVNLCDVLPDIFAAISTADGHNAVQPGDIMIYHMRVTSPSGRQYSYVDGSVRLGTVPGTPTAEGAFGTGFEGYPIPKVTSGAGYAFTPRRGLNAALLALGVGQDGYPTDEVVGALLRMAGYGDAQQTDAQITQSCLAQYYLDFLNTRREGNKAQSFQDLTPEELASLTDSSTSKIVPETNEDMVEALYYLYYGVGYLFNGMPLYAHMQSNEALNAAFAASLAKDGRFDLVSSLDLLLLQNAFQNTRFGYGMQFELAAKATATPTPTSMPTPTPTLTPTPTPEAAKPPKTGDDTPLAAMALLMGLALAGLAWALRRKSRKSN